MSGFIIVAVIVVFGVIMTGSFSGKNSKNRIQKQIAVLQGARRNADVTELLDLIVRASHMPLSKDQQARVADIVDKFIAGNDITAAKSTKELLEKFLSTGTQAVAAKAPTYTKASPSRLSVLIKRMDAIQKPNSDIGEIHALLKQANPNSLDTNAIEELSSIVITILNAANTEKKPTTIKNITAPLLIKAKTILGKNVKNAESLLTKNVKPDNTINNIVSKTIKEGEPAKKLKVTTANVIETASVAPVMSLLDTITAINIAKNGLVEKKLCEHVDSIVFLLGQITEQNGKAAARYSRYLLSMLNELATKPAHAQMAAMIITANMLNVYQALADGVYIDMENAEKMIRIDLHMRSFSLEAIS